MSKPACVWCHGLKRIVRDYMEERGVVSYTYDCPRCVAASPLGSGVPALDPVTVEACAKVAGEAEKEICEHCELGKRWEPCTCVSTAYRIRSLTSQPGGGK